MSPPELIAILRNRLAHNAIQRSQAIQRGDISTVAALDADTLSTEASIAALEATL